MTLALASRFKREIIPNFILGTLAACLTACVVVPPPEQVQEKIDPAAADGESPPERKILPPSPSPGEAKSQNSKSDIDKILATLPAEARDPDTEISIPIDTLDSSPYGLSDSSLRRRSEMQNRRTDNEIVKASKNMDDRKNKDLGELDRELDVAPTEKSGAAPSYIAALQRIKDHYKYREYEDALVETNETLRHYPRSAQLLTMKGTLYQRLNQIELALASYERAYDIEPTRKLLAQIDHLRSVLNDRALIAKPRNTLVLPGETSPTTNPAKGGP